MREMTPEEAAEACGGAAAIPISTDGPWPYFLTPDPWWRDPRTGPRDTCFGSYCEP